MPPKVRQTRRISPMKEKKSLSVPRIKPSSFSANPGTSSKRKPAHFAISSLSRVEEDRTSGERLMELG